MPLFHILPADGSSPPLAIAHPDGQCLFSAIHALDCQEAHVWRDCRYAFSISLNSHGVWRIFTRPPKNITEQTPASERNRLMKRHAQFLPRGSSNSSNLAKSKIGWPDDACSVRSETVSPREANSDLEASIGA